MPLHPLRPLSLMPIVEDGLRPGGASAVPGAWASVLDSGALARLSELDPKGQAGLVGRVLATYTQSLARLLDELARARAAADLESMRHVAHTLKSSSASVGALHLSGLCADIERKVRDRDTEGLDAQLDAMASEGGRVLAALGPARSASTLRS